MVRSWSEAEVSNCLREEMPMRRVEPIGKKTRELYGAIVKSEPQSAELAGRRLYRNAFKVARIRELVIEKIMPLS
jgi:hypothetical protein